MRAIQEATELSYESFIETFGNVNTKRADSGESSTTREIMSQSSSRLPVCMEPGETRQDDVTNNNTGDTRKNSLGVCSATSSNESNPDSVKHKKETSGGTRKRRLRKISIDRLSSFGGAVQAAVTSRRRKSTGFAGNVTSMDSKDEGRASGWLSSLPPYIAGKLASESGSYSNDDADDSSSGSISIRGGSNPKPAVFRIPAARLGATAHRGFLDCRNKKKQWERFWCVLQDACLYCYHTPQSDVTRDAILLRGYEVIADVTNLNRSRFVFRLQQQGVPTLHFSSDNHRDFLLWVGSLEKETRSVNTTSNAQKPTDESNSDRQRNTAATKHHRASLPNISITPIGRRRRSSLTRTVSQERLEDELIKMQKHKLLKEIAVQQQQILEEQKLLDKMPTNSTGSSPTSGTSPTNRLSREEVIEHYENERAQEELKTTKFLTFLNRRRNSAHLKMVQYTRDLAPKNGHRRRDNHAQFSAMESRLKDMQEALAQVDREFEEEEATKQHNIEKLHHKRDLELLILEQRDAIAILRRHHSKGVSHRRHSSHDVLMTPPSRRSCDTLTSIDEMSSISDDRVTSSTASSLSDTVGVPSYPDYPAPAMSTPRAPVRRHGTSQPPPACMVQWEPCSRRTSNDGAISSDADSGFQPANDHGDLDSSPLFRISANNTIRSKLESVDSATEVDGCGASFAESCFYKVSPATSSRDSTLKSQSPMGAKEEVDSSILAKIEDFEIFAKLKLQEASES